MFHTRMWFGLCAILIASLCASSAHAMKGAIFTTNANGTIVNGNNYANACDVYLNGGPPPNAPCGSAGLSNGEYYFQVTNSSGSVLLSTDNIEQRRFKVQGGVIVQYLGSSSACNHQTGLGKCNQSNPNNISVQLMPFNQTPGSSNVYKAWVTPVNKYQPNNPQTKFGFHSCWSKTDNFKCPPPTQEPPKCSIVINKFYDANANGNNDGDDEFPIDGFHFQVCYTPQGSAGANCVTVTAGQDGLGQALLDIPPGSYVTVVEQIPQTDEEECKWVQTLPNDQSENVTVIDGQWSYAFQTPANASSVHTLVFGNVTACEATKGKSTGYWKSSNGKSKLSKNDPSWRNNLNKYPLRKISGGIFKVSTSAEFADAYASFRSWLAASSYTNMANQLSQQAAAVRLSVLYNGLNANHRMLIPSDQAQIIGAEENALQIKTILQLAVDSLSQYGKTNNTHPQRPYQEALKLILKAISLNDLPVVNQTPAEIIYPEN